MREIFTIFTQCCTLLGSAESMLKISAELLAARSDSWDRDSMAMATYE
jgi:hypothetical protein